MVGKFKPLEGTPGSQEETYHVMLMYTFDNIAFLTYLMPFLRFNSPIELQCSQASSAKLGTVTKHLRLINSVYC
jgi:hypothetical protein